MKRLPPQFVPRCGTRSTRRTSESRSSDFQKRLASVSAQAAGDGIVVVPAGGPDVERQDSVAREIRRNRLCRGGMDLHHFVVIVEDGIDDRVSETVGQIGTCDREVIDAQSLIVAPQRWIAAGRDV